MSTSAICEITGRKKNLRKEGSSKGFHWAVVARGTILLGNQCV